MVVEHQDTFVFVQTQHRLVDHDPGKLVFDQTQHRLVDEVQNKLGIAGIVVDDTMVAMVVSHQCKLDQVMNILNQCNSESF